jgi:tetratricopeptide (TPR) repeat protein
MAEAGPGAAGGYVAFISYSHRDAAAGRWLHRKLEGYRLPRRLAGTQGEDGEVPARLTPIFRDRDELPAAGDLSERVRAALAVSRNLIVICSPHSAASPWVAKEIATFRELHPDRPIFTAIVDGEPDHCFPPALREGGIEPLAADLRKQGDGRRLGLLKLVAGLAGIGLDPLAQRDAQRRIRNVTYVTAAAVAAMLAMALLTLSAVNARAEAERQRSKAEGLVEFMLTDLRAELKGVGSIRVMKIVNARAIAYYGDTKALGRLSDESLERRARVLHAMGEDYEKSGDFESALARFREAHAVTAATLSRHGDDPGAIFAHGQSEYWIGHAHELRGEWPQARDRYERYARAARRLIAIDPNNPDYMMEMGWGSSNVGLAELHGRKRPDRAEPYFEDSVRWFLRAARLRPGDRSITGEIANAYNILAQTFYDRKMWPQARTAYLEQQRATLRLEADAPDDLDTRYRLAIVERSLARVSEKLGEPGKSMALLASAHRRSESLTARDSENAEWLLLKTKVECDMLNLAARDRPVAPERLRSSIRAAAARFAAQGYPRASEVARCLQKVALLAPAGPAKGTGRVTAIT